MFFGSKGKRTVEELSQAEAKAPPLECSLVYTLANLDSDVVVGKDVFNDIEVFHPYDNESMDSTLASIVDRHTQTKGGSKFLRGILATPQHDAEVLKARSRCIHELDESKSIIDASLSLSRMEQDFLWMFAQKDEAVSNILDGIYFNQFFNKKCNDYAGVLTSYNIYKILVSPTIGILSPVMFFILPYMILMYTFGKSFNVSFSTYMRTLWKSFFQTPNLFALLGPRGKLIGRINTISYILSMCFYFQGILNSVQLSYTTHQIVKYICDKTNNAMVFLRHALEVSETNKTVIDTYKRFYSNLDALPADVEQSTVTMLESYKPYKKFSMLSQFGIQLKLYKSFDRDLFKPLVNRLYFLDALFAVKKLSSELKLSIPEYLGNDRTSPVYACVGAWNIHLDKNIAVCNDFQATNTIITGPNAGGKSTFVKMIVTNALLAQTLCVTSCESLQMTPFKVISTQINIPDCKGHESLFEAEMNRCLYNLNTMLEYKSQPCLVALDEIFSSTNVIEAISGAYAILENMASQENTLTIVTTHLSYLTNLKKTTTFQCKRMSVIISSGEGDSALISYPYRLMDGVSKQYIALELLRNKGFDKSIVDRAIAVKTKFTKHGKST